MLKLNHRCPSPCPLIALVANRDVHDRPLAPEHFVCAWQALAPFVSQRVRAELWRLPLRRQRELVLERCPGIRCPSSSQVRAALARDRMLVEDLTQDVGVVVSRFGLHQCFFI